MKKALGALAALIVAGVLALGASPSSGSTFRVHADPPLGYQLHDAGKLPAVYVENHAGSAWRVSRYAHDWAPIFRFRSCVADHPCLNVYSGDYGASGTVGLTRPCFQLASVCSSKIQLNNYKPYLAGGANVRYEAVIHEFGHVVGLGHDNSGGALAPVDNGGSVYVSAFERSEVSRMYGASFG